MHRGLIITDHFAIRYIYLRPDKDGLFGGSVPSLQDMEVLKMLSLWNEPYFHKGLMTIVCGFYFHALAWLQVSTQSSLTGPGRVPNTPPLLCTQDSEVIDH